jgi:hypothetical protein
MNIREISKPITAKSLNESLAKRFGQKINLQAFTLEQLQDTRNKLRTKLSQVETNESFESVHKSDTYQKSKLFLDVLNAEISEREDVSEKKAKPDYLDFDGDGNKKEPMKKALKDKKKKKVGEADAQPNENDPAYVAIKKKYEEAFRTGNRAMGRLLAGLLKDVYGEDPTVGGMFSQRTGTAANQGNAQPAGMQGAVDVLDSIEESVVTEGAEDQAELVMAAKDMVDRLTGWMEDTAEMQTESMLELADAIRDEMGQEQSDQFVGSVKPALESLYAAMETTRTALTGGVGMLTGEGEPVDMMGGDAGVPADTGTGLGEPEPEMEPTVDADEFGAADAAAGGDEEAGREKRESIQRSKKKLSENSRKLATLLSKKKS